MLMASLLMASLLALHLNAFETSSTLNLRPPAIYEPTIDKKMHFVVQKFVPDRNDEDAGSFRTPL